jgi:phospholipid/cholesterol/gamma-HCH transport system permease protein
MVSEDKAMASRTLDIGSIIGDRVLDAASHVGRITYFTLDAIRGLREVKIWWPRAMQEAWNIGVGSLFIVLLISSFAGAVTALQTGYQFTGSIPYYVVGTLVVSSIVLELGPVLTALILAGRIGARYAAELGTMRVTEQIDALESLGRSPVTHLLLPRCLAGILVIPALVMISNATGFLVGWFAAKQSLGITNAEFTYGARYFFRSFDLWYSGIKAVCFAVAVTLIPCYIGFNTKQGAEGVGRATTQAVVAASVTILLLDVVLAQVLLGK